MNKFKEAVLKEAEEDRELVLYAKRNLLIKSRLKDLTDDEAERIATVMELDVVFEGLDRSDKKGTDCDKACPEIKPKMRMPSGNPRVYW